MGVPVEVLELQRYQGGACTHLLLTRVRRPGASNADHGMTDAAEAFADSTAAHLRDWWERWRLPARCGPHRPDLVGRSEEPPTGDELYGTGLRVLNVWTVPTKYGAPWVLFGTAANEQALRSALREDGENITPDVPVTRHRTYFLTDMDGGADLANP